MQLLGGGVVEINGGYRQAVARALKTLPEEPDAIAHRVVHGGDRFADAVAVDIPLLNELRELGPLAPLHNGPALEGIGATLGLGIPLVAAFDTAFHRTLPERAWRYALPELAGVHRNGFHGWSHRSVMECYAELFGNTRPTIITRNQVGEERISSSASSIEVYPIRTDEERIIAREAWRLLAPGAA